MVEILRSPVRSLGSWNLPLFTKIWNHHPNGGFSPGHQGWLGSWEAWMVDGDRFGWVDMSSHVRMRKIITSYTSYMSSHVTISWGKPTNFFTKNPLVSEGEGKILSQMDYWRVLLDFTIKNKRGLATAMLWFWWTHLDTLYMRWPALRVFAVQVGFHPNFSFTKKVRGIFCDKDDSNGVNLWYLDLVCICTRWAPTSDKGAYTLIRRVIIPLTHLFLAIYKALYQ